MKQDRKITLGLSRSGKQVQIRYTVKQDGRLLGEYRAGYALSEVLAYLEGKRGKTKFLTFEKVTPYALGEGEPGNKGVENPEKLSVAINGEKNEL